MTERKEIRHAEKTEQSHRKMVQLPRRKNDVPYFTARRPIAKASPHKGCSTPVATNETPTIDAAAIVRDLDALQAEEVEDRKATLERKYVRLGQAYAHGLRLRDDEDLRDQFFAAEHWADFEGHKPRLGRDGRDRAMHFAVMRVFGGTPEGRREASLFAQAATYLAELNTPAEDFVDELRTKPGAKGRVGPRALADLAREERRRARQSVQGERGPGPQPRATGSIGGLRITVQHSVPTSPECEIFVIVHEGHLVLSSSPDKFEPVLAAPQ